MLDYKKFKKMISIFIVIAFFFNIPNGILLHSQEADELENQFNKAKHAYTEVKYSEAIQRIERIIQYNPDRKDLLGKCYLLLGAIYENLGEKQKAEENYKKAIYDYGIEFIEEIDLENLPIYQKIIKEKREQEKVIEKDGKKKKKKKFPWLLVVGGTAAVVVIVILLSKGKKYSLNVDVDEGVDGTPGTGNYKYKKGTIVNYNYTLNPGYNTLEVQLDGTPVSPSGTITMNQNHTLTASANTNVVTFNTNTDTIEIPEGQTATFNVRLSAQPTAEVNVTVDRESGDTDISVITGGNLTFTTTNWNMDQTVTLQAAEDADTTNSPAAIAISAPGIEQKNINVTELDNDNINFVTDTNSLEINEGQRASFNVKLSIDPGKNITAAVARESGDTDIEVVSGDNLTFNTSNWDTYQTVTLKAEKDNDFEDGQAIIAVTAAGIESKKITVNEIDSRLRVEILHPKNNDNISGTVPIEADASGLYGIDKVEFLVDGIIKGTVSTAPYSYDWDTSDDIAGPHVIKVTAYDTRGKTAEDQITVTVVK